VSELIRQRSSPGSSIGSDRSPVALADKPYVYWRRDPRAIFLP
jgi:hypothetical protein